MLNIQKINFKKKLLITNKNGKDRKYHLDEVISRKNYSLYRCQYYRFLYTEQINASTFKYLFNSKSFDDYMKGQCQFPFSLCYDLKHGFTDMCITILYKDGKVDKILDHYETIDFFDSLNLMNKLGGSI